jgi:secreted trypsin-like serine protease
MGKVRVSESPPEFGRRLTTKHFLQTPLFHGCRETKCLIFINLPPFIRSALFSMKNLLLSGILLASISFTEAAYSQSKIVGGTGVTPGQYPWMAAIADTTGGSLFDRQSCGGSLIDPYWILTAAHCMDGESISGVQMVVNVTDLDDTSGAEIRGVRGIYIHPGFKDINGDLFNDVALVLLDSPINTVTPIEYATAFNDVVTGDSVRAIGWGDTQSSPKFPTNLRMVDVLIKSISSANKAYGINRLDGRHLAASASGKDTCSGDSGGPLFDLDGAPGSQPLLVGITSYGLGCAKAGIPGIYANVGNFAPWIDNFLAQPTTVDPIATVTGRSLEIPSGSSSTSVSKGTNFGRRLRSGRTATRQFVISNAAAVIPLSITAVRTTGRNFTVQSPPRYVFEGESATISVKFRAPYSRRNGVSRSALTIRTNDPAAAYTFRLAAKYRKDRGSSRFR